jgi:sugar fermentation stimulation protein A
MRPVLAFANPVFVPFDAPLQPGVLVDRRDRFVAEVTLDSHPGQPVLAHCINPGRMEAFVEVGARVWLIPAARADRKLRFTWEAIEAVGIDGARLLCSTNTVRPNRLVRALLEARCLAGLESYSTLQAECKFSVPAAESGGEEHSGRVDFLLDSASASPHYVEVKNCHMVYQDGWGYFPDSVSERASRHVEALAALVRAGACASVILVVQRDDVRHGVRPSAFHDPAFAAAAARAAAAGVRFRAVRAAVGLDGTRLTHEMPVDVEGATAPTVVAAVGRQWELNRPTSGWTRSASGQRVANGPFPHHLAAARAKAAAAKAEAKVAKGTGSAVAPKAARGKGQNRVAIEAAADAETAVVPAPAAAKEPTLKAKVTGDLRYTWSPGQPPASDAPPRGVKRLRSGNGVLQAAGAEVEGGGGGKSATASGAAVSGRTSRFFPVGS